VVLQKGRQVALFIVGRLRRDAQGLLLQPTSDFSLSDEDSRLDSQKDKRVHFNP
jgi:hypothetical protein